MKNYDCVAVFSTPLYVDNEIVYGIFFDTNILRKKLKHPWYQDWKWTFSDIIKEYVSHLKRKHAKQNPNHEIDNFSHTVLFFDHPIIAEKDIYSGHLITNKNYIDNLPSSYHDIKPLAI